MANIVTKSQYGEILDKIIFSFSTLHQYEQCPFAFYERKIDGTEINEGNFYAEVGSFVHEINEKIFNKTLDIDKAIDYFIDNYDNNVVYTTKQSTMDKKYNQGIDYLAAFDTEKLENYDIIGVEKKVNFEIEGYKFVGFIDLLLRNKNTGKILLVDHKSSGKFLGKNGNPLKNQLSQFEAYSKQMYLYSKAVFDEYGEYPDRIIWNHFFDQQVTNISFDMIDYENSLKWAVDIIHAIYKDKKFNAKQTYMMCKILCGYRNSCCYANEEEGE